MKDLFQRFITLFKTKPVPVESPAIPEPILSDIEFQLSQTGVTVYTQFDRLSAAGQKITAYCEHRMSVLRAMNDSDHTEIETAAIRGGIRELKKILSLGKEPQREK